jgi:hypothetical protein
MPPFVALGATAVVGADAVPLFRRPPGPGARTLEQTIQGNRLNVRFIVGGHGQVVPYAQSRAAIGQPLRPA